MENVKNPKQIEIIGNEIVVFGKNENLGNEALVSCFNNSDGSRLDFNDNSLRFPKTAEDAERIRKSLPAGYELSDEFLSLVNAQESQPENAAASCSVPPLVDSLLNEHPDRCIVVSGFTDADQYFPCKVSHLDGVFNESDNSWRFSLATLPLLLVYYPAPDYQHSEILKREFEPIKCGF